MKAIDEKGRILGKLNLIDLLVILLVLAVGIFLGMKVFGSDLGGNTVRGGTLIYTAKVTGVDPEVCSFIQAEVAKGPQQLMAGGVMVDAYVTGVEATPSDQSISIHTSTGALVVPLDGDRMDLVFTIEATVEDKVTCEVGTQEVRVGKTHIVKTTTFELERSTILSCVWKEEA